MTMDRSGALGQGQGDDQGRDAEVAGFLTLLQRLYLADVVWIVKVATALPAHDLGARASLDVRVCRDAARPIAEGG